MLETNRRVTVESFRIIFVGRDKSSKGAIVVERVDCTCRDLGTYSTRTMLSASDCNASPFSRGISSIGFTYYFWSSTRVIYVSYTIRGACIHHDAVEKKNVDLRHVKTDCGAREFTRSSVLIMYAYDASDAVTVACRSRDVTQFSIVIRIRLQRYPCGIALCAAAYRYTVVG